MSIAPWWVLSSFIASLSLWLVNEKVRNHRRGIDKLHGLYLLHYTNGQINMCSIASSVKLCTNSSKPGWFHAETFMHVLRLWFANTAAAKIAIKKSTTMDCKIISSCIDSHHELWNMQLTFMLKQIDLHSFLPVIYVPIQPFLYVNKLLLTSTWQS